MALIALEPHESTQDNLAAGTYCVLQAERLRAMLGRQRGTASLSVLRDVAEFMTQRQAAGLPVAELQAPYHGFKMGPSFVARGYSVVQLLDAAVRSVSAFGSADDLIDEEEAREVPRHTVKTAEFLKTLKRYVAGDDADTKARFEKVMRLNADLPEMTVDYAYHRWLVQATSLPATQKQAVNTLRESQSKLYEIDMIRKHLDGNAVCPVLLINKDVLTDDAPAAVQSQARAMLDRLERLAKASGLETIAVFSPQEAAQQLVALN